MLSSPLSLLSSSLTSSSSLPVVLTILAGCPCRHRHHPRCHRPCHRRRPRLSSLPSLPSPSLSSSFLLLLFSPVVLAVIAVVLNASSLTSSSSSPVDLTVLAGHPCRRCHHPRCCRPYRRRCPHSLSLPSLPVVVAVLDVVVVVLACCHHCCRHHRCRRCRHSFRCLFQLVVVYSLSLPSSLSSPSSLSLPSLSPL